MKATTLVAALVAAIAAIVAALLPASDPDVWWHLQSGEWMLDHRQLLDHDVFSFTRAGAPYASGQWLGQVILAVAFRAGGWLGLDVLRAVLVGIGAFFLSRITLRLQPHPAWAVPVVAVALLVSKITWGDRPQLFTIALFPVVLDLVLAARLEGKWRGLIAVPPLLMLWANLHSAFAAGLALIALVAFDAVIRRSSWRPCVLTLAASAVLTQLNPAALGVLGRPAAYATTSLGFIVEEQPPDVLGAPGLLFAALLLASLGAVLVLGTDRIRDEGRLAARLGSPGLWALLIAPFALLGLSVQRQMPLACAVLAPFVAAVLPVALGRVPAIAPRVPRVAAALFLAGLAVAVGALVATAAPREPDLSAYPADALAALRGRPGNLLNEHDWGGYLIHEAPEHPTFIDGRGVLLFVPEILDDFQRAVAVRPGYRDVLRRWDIRLALLKPERPLTEVLRADGWRTLASGTRFVLLERP